MIPTEKFLLIYSYAKAPKQYAMIPVLFLIFVKIPYQKVGFLRQAFTLIFCPGKEKEWRFWWLLIGLDTKGIHQTRIHPSYYGQKGWWNGGGKFRRERGRIISLKTFKINHFIIWIIWQDIKNVFFQSMTSSRRWKFVSLIHRYLCYKLYLLFCFCVATTRQVLLLFCFLVNGTNDWLISWLHFIV